MIVSSNNYFSFEDLTEQKALTLLNTGNIPLTIFTSHRDEFLIYP